MREPVDKTSEGKTADGMLQIARGDVCDAFEQDTDRLFSNRECWYCKYGDFGIFTEHPTQQGVCSFKMTNSGILDSLETQCACDLAIQLTEKKEKETT